MKLIEIKCPNCNASLEVDADRQFLFCQYCGTKIAVDDEVNRSETTYIIRDEAKIKEAEAKEKIALSEIELERNWQENRKKSMRRWRKCMLVLLIVGLVLLLVGFIFRNFNEETSDMLLAIGMFAIAWTVIILVYGAFGYFVSMISHNRKRRSK